MDDPGLISFFSSLPDSPNNVYLFEKSPENYCSCGKDAQLAASVVYKTTSVLKYAGDIAICSISRGNLPVFLQEIVQKYNLIVYKYSDRKWQLDRRSTPGNLSQVEDLLDVLCDTVIMAVSCQRKDDILTISSAFMNSSLSSKIQYTQFVDTETYPNFLSLISQTNVKEILLSDESSYEMSQLSKILSNCSVVVTKVKKSEFPEDNTVDRFTSIESSVDSCIYALIKYLNVTDQDIACSKYDMAEYMKLNMTTINSLNLLGPKSLFSVLNQCRTAQGSRLLEQWIRLPLIQKSEIETRLSLVDIFYNDNLLLENIRDELKHFPDLYRLAKKFRKQSANLQDVVRVYQVLVRIPIMIEVLENYDGEYKWLLTEKFLSPLKNHFENLIKLKEMVETTVDLEAADRHEYIIKAEFDEELMSFKNSMDDLLGQMEYEAKKVSEELDLEYEKKLKFERNSIYGYHLRVTRTDANKIRGKGYIELNTQKAGVLFATSSLKRLSGEYSDNEDKYKAQQSSLVKEVIGITSSYFPILDEVNDVIACLDVIESFAFASLRAPLPYVRPTISSRDGDLIIKAGRHPCVEVQDTVSFIPNDVSMIRKESSFQIITGPNMGGKSTYIRQVAIIAIMSQIGCFVPCENAEMCIFDSIMTRIGASDSQLKGISTFMSEMLETASIIRNATEDSLVIIDELGRGTSTYDGFGLAWAIAEKIATDIKCFAFFATHFHELTTLAERIPHVKNRHVLVHTSPQEITLLYKVEDGVCDESFGIHVAEIVKFPTDVVKLSKRKVQELESSETSQKTTKLWKSDDAAIESGLSEIRNYLKRFSNMNNPSPDAIMEINQDFAGVIANNPFIQERIKLICISKRTQQFQHSMEVSPLQGSVESPMQHLSMPRDSKMSISEDDCRFVGVLPPGLEMAAPPATTEKSILGGIEHEKVKSVDIHVGIEIPDKLNSLIGITEVGDRSRAINSIDLHIQRQIEEDFIKLNELEVQDKIRVIQYFFEHVRHCKPQNIERYRETGIRTLKRIATNGGISDAQYYLGKIYADKMPGHLPKYHKAERWFSLAAKREHPEALYRLGEILENGYGTAKNIGQAIHNYRKASSFNHPGAMYRLGMIMMERRDQGHENIRDGLKWLRLSAKYANREHPNALYELAMIHASGIKDFVWPDPSYTAKLLSEAVTLGHVHSMYTLGKAYCHGYYGLEIDIFLAVVYFQKAADRQHCEAMFEVAGYLLTGYKKQSRNFVLEPFPEKAFKLMYKAAEAGSSKAMFAVGYFYEKGIGCTENTDLAELWYTKAASHGCDQAIKWFKDHEKSFPRYEITNKRSRKKDPYCLIM